MHTIRVGFRGSKPLVRIHVYNTNAFTPPQKCRMEYTQLVYFNHSLTR